MRIKVIAKTYAQFFDLTAEVELDTVVEHVIAAMERDLNQGIFTKWGLEHSTIWARNLAQYVNIGQLMEQAHHPQLLQISIGEPVLD